MDMTEIRPIPGPGFVARLLVSSWVDPMRDSDAPVPFMLIGHPGPRHPGETTESVERGLLGMADAMRLSPASDRVPHIGPRLLIGGRVTALDYGHPSFFFRVPSPSARWRELVARGQLACMTLCLDPVPFGAGPDGTEAFIGRSIANGRALMGAVSARTR